MAVPYTFAGATSAIPLSQLDTNFATTFTLGNTAIQLGNTVTTLNNMTLANVTISSGNVTITNVSVTTANVTTGNITTLTSTNATITNMSSGNVTITGGTINGTTLGATTASSANVTTLTTSSTVTLNGGTANGVAYLNGSKVLTTGSALTFDGANLGVPAEVYRTSDSSYMRLAGGNPAATGATVLMFGSTHATNPNRLSLTAPGATSTSYIDFNAAGAEGMRLTSTGLGIGTSSPASKLDVTNTAADSVLSITVAGVQRWQHRVMLATGYWQLHDPTSGNTRLTVDTSGNLGIGTSSPAYKLDVVGPVQSSAGYYINGNTSGGYVLVRDNYALRFGTNDTERAQITSGGYFKASNDGTYQNSAGPYHELYKSANNADWVAAVIHAGATAGNQYGLKVDLTGDPNGAGNEFLYCEGAATLRASIRSNGGLANYQANDVNLSDQRLKTDVQPAGTYLDKICAIPVKTFLYKDQTDTERNLGVMAQDVDAVAPELIDHSGFGKAPEGESPYLAVYQTDLQYALMKCIQELKAQNDDLRARVAALETK